LRIVDRLLLASALVVMAASLVAFAALVVLGAGRL